MHRLKRVFWGLKAELKLLVLCFASVLPGTLGVVIRGAILRPFFQQLGRNSVFLSGVRLTNPEKIRIGSNCTFSHGLFITGGGGVHIGDWVGFGPDTKVWSVNHRFEDPDRPWQQQGWDLKPVVIEDDVWLGANVFVMPGVTIGKGAIVSAGAVVNKSIPAYAIVTGNPGRVVGWRRKPAQEAASAADRAAGDTADSAGAKVDA